MARLFGARRSLIRAQGGLSAAQGYIESLSGKVAYWPLQDTDNTALAYDDNGLNSALYGTHSNVTPRQIASGGLGYAAGYNGSTSYTNVYSATFNSAFSRTTGSVVAFIQNNDWTPAAQVGVFRFLMDVSNYLNILSAGTNSLRGQGITNSSVASFTGSGQSDTSKFYSAVLTWQPNAANTDWNFYIDDTQVETTKQTTGALTGNFNSTQTVIGALSTTPVNSWDGKLCHVAIFDRVLTGGEIGALAGLV